MAAEQFVVRDLKLPEGRAEAIALVTRANALIEGNRPV
jgi:hypothetical protein